MSGLPWYKRDPSAFLDGCATGNLTLEEVGAYAILIDEMYRIGRPLVDNARWCASLLRIDVRVWNRVRDALILKGKIYATSGGHLSNLRVESELRTQYDMREKKRRAGRAGGEAKAANAHYNSVTEPQLSDSYAIAKPELTPTGVHKSLKTLTSALAQGGDFATVDKDIDIELPTGVVGTSVPTSIDEPISEAIEAYNQTAKRAGWIVSRLPVTAKRRRYTRARLKEVGIDGWRAQLAEAESQPFLAGVNDKGWRVDLEFFASESGWTRIAEGKYRRGPQKPAAKAIDWAGFIAMWRADPTCWPSSLGPKPNEPGYRGPPVPKPDLFAIAGGNQ